jgi:HTH-type transcriptional regulator / antitoxin HipB
LQTVHIEAYYRDMYRIENMETAGNALRTQRESLGMTQAELAAAAGLTRARLSLIERGRTNVSLASYLRLAEALALQLALDPIAERPTLHQLRRELQRAP